MLFLYHYACFFSWLSFHLNCHLSTCLLPESSICHRLQVATTFFCSPALISFKPHPKLKICCIYLFIFLKSESSLHIRRFYGLHKPNQDLVSNQSNIQTQGSKHFLTSNMNNPHANGTVSFLKDLLVQLPSHNRKTQVLVLTRSFVKRVRRGYRLEEPFDISPQVFHLVLLFLMSFVLAQTL